MKYKQLFEENDSSDIDTRTFHAVRKYMNSDTVNDSPAGKSYYSEKRLSKDEKNSLHNDVRALGWAKSRDGHKGIGVGHYVFNHPDTETELNLYHGSGMVKDTAFFHRKVK